MERFFPMHEGLLAAKRDSVERAALQAERKLMAASLERALADFHDDPMLQLAAVEGDPLSRVSAIDVVSAVTTSDEEFKALLDEPMTKERFDRLAAVVDEPVLKRVIASVPVMLRLGESHGFEFEDMMNDRFVHWEVQDVRRYNDSYVEFVVLGWVSDE